MPPPKGRFFAPTAAGRVRRHPPHPLARRRALPCAYLDAAHKVYECPAGDPFRHTHDCLHEDCGAVHGDRGVVSRERDCESCPHYELPPAGPFPVRHLLYHLYPVAGNGRWQHRVRRLVERLPLFTGRRVVVICVGAPGHTAGSLQNHARLAGAFDPPEVVRAAFGAAAGTIEFVEVPNDPQLREVASWGPLWERLAGEPAAGAAVLYAQSKGVTYADPHHPCHRWGDVLEEICCDHWPLVESQLGRHPVTGAFLKRGHGWRAHESASDWHYSGSWFWARLADVQARDWRKIDRFWSGVEPWPSLHFRPEDAGCLFLDRPGHQLNLYDAGFWRDTGEPEYAKWRAERAR